MFGFPLGTLCGARLRLSFLFPVAALALMWRLEDPALGLLACGILLFSVVIHELAHLLLVRASGGEMDEIHLWPLGGLSEPYGRGYLADHARTLAAGPMMNFVLAASCLLTLSSSEWLPLLNPLNGFPIVAGEHIISTACRFAFFLNVILFAVNLLPLTPFDGGIWLRTYLNTRFSEVESRDLMVRLGLVLGILGMLVGFVFDRSVITAVAAFVVVLQIHESLRWYEVVTTSDDFTDYDFSERESDDRSPDGFPENSNNADVLDRWQKRQDQERLERETAAREQEERQVDDILKKLHVHGRESLSTREIHLLKEVSDRYRNRQRH
ncbi:MAG: hypothetical protein R3C59_29775 [Planctomycetaceae bacterium]